MKTFLKYFVAAAVAVAVLATVMHHASFEGLMRTIHGG